MLTPGQLKLAAIAAAFLAAVAGGFLAGWTLNGWKLSGKINELAGVVETQKQSIETLAGANARCTAAVEDVKASVKGYIEAGEARSAQAQAAMEAAARAARGHLAAARDALNRPAPKAGEECATAAAEATAYARKRKGAP